MATTTMAASDEFGGESPPSSDRGVSSAPSEAMLARAERNRRRALSLRQARASIVSTARSRALDTGGGFLPEEIEVEEGTQRPLTSRPAPILDPEERPSCLECDRPVSTSYLLDTFHHPVCDDCRDAEGAHSLLTRTEAKAAYLLQDCDMDARGEGPLPCVRRRNPHQTRTDMRLYLRAQVEKRALEVWGSEERLRAELTRRDEARERATTKREARRLRALRLEARSSLFRAPRASHAHVFGPETYDAEADLYSRTCACGHAESYEKM